jgi:pyruvate kinase
MWDIFGPSWNISDYGRGNMRRTKIVCTIGPASENYQTLQTMIRAGMNVARLNFSHGSHAEHKVRIETVRKAAESLGQPVAILLDTKGPEIRIGLFKDKKIALQEGDIFTLTTREVEGTQEIVTVYYHQLPQDVQPGSSILLDDGLIDLKVLEIINGTDIKCMVQNPGELSDRKRINLPGIAVSLPAMSDKDIADIQFGIEMGVDFIAASFIQKAVDVLAIRKLIEDAGADISIIAKIENEAGVTHLDEILKVADGLMVARGDLGVEIPAEEVPIVQKRMIEKCNRVGKPVITATQMLDSMIRNPRPTRAEASDIANAIFDGTDAIMLSGESAAGKYPVESVQTMARIAARSEEVLDYDALLKRKGFSGRCTTTDAISQASAQTAMGLGAAAIVTSTESGYTARMLSKYRPQVPIIAVTPNYKTMRRLQLTWGVFPLQGPRTRSTDDMIDSAVRSALEAKFLSEGDLIVITAGVPVGIPGTTNLIKVHVVGAVLIRGVGIGSQGATGRVCLARTLKEAATKFQDGDILVTDSTDSEFVPYMKRAVAIVAEEGGLTSHAAIAGLNLGVPVIVGAEGALEILEEGMVATIDPIRGLIYKGETRVI